MNKSIIWSYTTEQFKDIINTSPSISAALLSLGLSNKGNNYKTLKRRCDQENINYQELVTRSKNNNMKNLLLVTSKLKIPNSILFIDDSSTSRHIVKNRIISENIIPYECSDCGNTGEHNGKKLSLHLDHINGKSNDNRLINLRFLCPNCHSQTDTYCGKAKSIPSKVCPQCSINIVKSKSNICRQCSSKNNRKVDRPSYTELLSHIDNGTPFTQIGKLYNVSDNCIRKWIKQYKHVKEQQ